MSKLKEAIKKANEMEVDPRVAEKRKENLDKVLQVLYKQASDIKKSIDEYNSMNRQARRLSTNKKQFEIAKAMAKSVMQRIDMFEQVKFEMNDDTSRS